MAKKEKAPKEKQVQDAPVKQSPQPTEPPVQNNPQVQETPKAGPPKISVEKAPTPPAVEPSITLKELTNGANVQKVAKQVLDYMAKNGAKEADISQFATKLYSTMNTMLKMPEYAHTRADKVAAQR